MSDMIASVKQRYGFDVVIGGCWNLEYTASLAYRSTSDAGPPRMDDWYVISPGGGA